LRAKSITSVIFVLGGLIRTDPAALPNAVVVDVKHGTDRRLAVLSTTNPIGVASSFKMSTR
jgi:hypothetical protein